MKSTKEAIFQQKTQNPSISGPKTFGIRFHQSAIEENFNPKHETQLKKNHSNNGGNYTHQYKEVKEKL